jgi:hypothetical protein
MIMKPNKNDNNLDITKSLNPFQSRLYDKQVKQRIVVIQTKESNVATSSIFLIENVKIIIGILEWEKISLKLS